MLCVTMTMVKFFFSSVQSSSILPVEMGSSAEVGSSMSQNLRLDGEGARDAKALLLPARKAERGFVQPVFEFVPHRRPLQGLFDDAVQLALAADAEGAGPVGDVVIDAHREGIGALEHHAHIFAEHGEIHAAVVNVDAAY